MDLKFYLNKFLKVDNIEAYPLEYLYKLRDLYMEFMDKSGGMDPDFPMVDFNGGKNKENKIRGKNKFQIDE